MEEDKILESNSAFGDKKLITNVLDEFTKEIARPALTTVDVRTPEVGQLAARTIIARIDGEKPKSTVLSPRLIERESVRHL